MSREEDDSLENLEALYKDEREIDNRRQRLIREREYLENKLQAIEAREELLEFASIADRIAETEQFKKKFCDAYERASGVVDLAELVASILAPSNPPIVVTGLVTVKIARIVADNYCAGL